MSQSTVEQLKNQVRTIVEELRGDMSPKYFYTYVAGLLIYKHLSENIEKYATRSLMETHSVSFTQFDEEFPDYEETIDALRESCIERLGYFLQTNFLFSSVLPRSKIAPCVIYGIKLSLWQLESSSMGMSLENEIVGTFDEMDFTWKKLGKTEIERSDRILGLMKRINEIELNLPESLKNITDQKQFLNNLLSFTDGYTLDGTSVEAPEDGIYINGIEYVPKGAIPELTDERLLAALKPLTEIQKNPEAQNRHLSLAMEALKALAPDIAKLPPEAAYKRVHGTET